MPKVALLTGATGGIGREILALLQLHHVPVLASAQSDEALQALQKEFPCIIDIYPADLGDPLARTRLLTWACQHDSLDLLINNAGCGLWGVSIEHEWSAIEKMMQINMQALVQLTHTLTSYWCQRAKKGTVLNIGSVAAHFERYPRFAVYAASKAFVRHYSRSLDDEMRQWGIRILVAELGRVETSFFQRAHAHAPRKWQLIPKGRVGNLLWKQIISQNPWQVIDWRYRLLSLCGRLLPEKLVAALMQRLG